MDTSADRGYSGILSRRSAVGLIMAQGNIGSTLTSYWVNIRLYMSTNGGYTWVEVVNQRSISVYQFLDFGSLIVYSKRWAYTNMFNYSCDEGLTWSPVDFPSQTLLRVAGLLTEIGERSSPCDYIWVQEWICWGLVHCGPKLHWRHDPPVY